MDGILSESNRLSQKRNEQNRTPRLRAARICFTFHYNLWHYDSWCFKLFMKRIDRFFAGRSMHCWVQWQGTVETPLFSRLIDSSDIDSDLSDSEESSGVTACRLPRQRNNMVRSGSRLGQSEIRIGRENLTNSWDSTDRKIWLLSVWLSM